MAQRSGEILTGSPLISKIIKGGLAVTLAATGAVAAQRVIEDGTVDKIGKLVSDYLPPSNAQQEPEVTVLPAGVKINGPQQEITVFPSLAPTQIKISTETVSPTPAPTETLTATATKESTPTLSPEQEQAYQDAVKQFGELGLNPDQYTLGYKNGVLVGTDLQGNEVYNNGFPLKFAVDNLKLHGDLLPTNYKPVDLNGALSPYYPSDAAEKYVFDFVKVFPDKNSGLSPFDKDSSFSPLMLNPEHNSWGAVMWNRGLTYLVFEKANKQTIWVSIQQGITGFDVVYYYAPTKPTINKTVNK